MGLINKPNTFTANTTASASEVNDNFDTIYNEFNGNIGAANLASNAVTTAKINDAAVTTAKLNDGSVTPAKLTSGAATTWAWQTWSPTWTNLTIGSATVVAKYAQVGKTIHYKLQITWAANTSQSAVDVQFTLPVTSTSDYSAYFPIGFGAALDASTSTRYYLSPGWFDTTHGVINSVQYNGSATGTQTLTIGGVTATAPVTWTTSDVWYVMGSYEAA